MAKTAKILQKSYCQSCSDDLKTLKRLAIERYVCCISLFGFKISFPKGRLDRTQSKQRASCLTLLEARFVLCALGRYDGGNNLKGWDCRLN